MRQTIADYVNNGPTVEELEAAKQNLINGFPLRIDSNKKILDNVANIAWVGLPLDTLDTWTDQVRQVTVEQIKQAFSKHIDMQAMVTVIVGGDER
jgi:zinc protease